jgi:hypothetical protein
VKLPEALAARLVFLSRVTAKECQHLLDTDSRLAQDFFNTRNPQRIAAEAALAERLDAFVSRFGRLQDTVGDKLLPALLLASAEPVQSAIENLDKAEKLGWIDSADIWLEMRKLRNQMVHEYIEDLVVLDNALQNGHVFVPRLVATARRCVAQADRLLA